LDLLGGLGGSILSLIIPEMILLKLGWAGGIGFFSSNLGKEEGSLSIMQDMGKIG